MKKYVYYCLLTFTFIVITYFFALYTNCFCIAEDCIWVIFVALEKLFNADHGSFIPVKLHTLINFQIPLLLKMHPQIFMTKYNIYLFGIFYTLTVFFMTKGLFLFNKQRLSLPLYTIINAIFLFSLSMLMAQDHYTCMFKEACTYIRFILGLLTFLLFINYFIKIFFIKKVTVINKKNLFLLFILSVISANTSEFNAFAGGLFCISLIVFYFIQRIKNNKTIKILTTALIGQITGTILIILNPQFQEHTYLEENRIGFGYSGKTFQEFINLWNYELWIPNLAYIILVIIFLFLIKSKYSKPIYKNILFISASLFISCNAFYLVLYYFAKETGELSHCDLKLVFIGCIIFNILLLAGFILRKIKCKFIVPIINLSVIALFSVFLYLKHNVIIEQTIQIRHNNQYRWKYLQNVEHIVLEQYNSNEDNVNIQIKHDPIMPTAYADDYVYRYMPAIYKKLIPGTYTVEWIQEETIQEENTNKEIIEEESTAEETTNEENPAEEITEEENTNETNEGE